ncbi:hypothetical protein NDU88_001528 [Pleurodeles waltl]|uniref:Uncharacterized protein n=1 Tax=Pleurodeles waltl TaxID=8319 RepID=A0AAV7U8C8_PLEWA|nr:hypothetical protein NDU88_001528 [Pleurodeles waltl]
MEARCPLEVVPRTENIALYEDTKSESEAADKIWRNKHSTEDEPSSIRHNMPEVALKQSSTPDEAFTPGRNTTNVFNTSHYVLPIATFLCCPRLELPNYPHRARVASESSAEEG